MTEYTWESARLYFDGTTPQGRKYFNKEQQ